MDTQFKYRAFISYSHADEKWAKWLHKALETYRVPKRLVGRETEFGPVPERLAPVFRDRDELATATNLGDILTRALRAVRVPARDLLAQVGEVALGQRGDQDLQAAGQGEPHLRADRRRRARRLGQARPRPTRNASRRR